MSAANHQKEYLSLLGQYLGSNPDALVWTLACMTYFHSIDDIIDGDKTDDEFILKTFRLAITIYSYHFYVANIHDLRPLVESAHDAYRDSVRLEKENDAKWKQHISDVIRQNANDLILKVIQLVAGLDARNEAALKFRELSYRTHHNELGERI